MLFQPLSVWHFPSPLTGLIDVTDHIYCSLFHCISPVLKNRRNRQAMSLEWIKNITVLKPNSAVQCFLTPERCFTSLATMSSLMRMKSRRWWGSTPNAFWMLRRSAAMSGRVDDSVQRGLRVMRHRDGVNPITNQFTNIDHSHHHGNV